MASKSWLRGIATFLLFFIVSGCNCGDSKIVTVPASDNTAPMVLITSPVNGSTAVALNSALSVTFSEAIDPATLTSFTFSVSGVPGTVNMSADNRSATYTPTAELAPDTLYTSNLTTGVQDTSGNGLESNFIWTFTTGAKVDTVAPMLLSVSPLSGAASQEASTTTISATFNEPLNCTTVSTESFHVLESSVAVLGYTECIGATISFKPLSGFGIPTNTMLQASMSPAIKDLAGNPIGAYSWPFGMAPWTRQSGTVSTDIAYGITSDAAGNIYATGYTDGALDGQTGAGDIDFFITKYDVSGLKQWTRQYGTASVDYGLAITHDSVGNVYVAGYTYGAMDGQSNAGQADIFIAKYDAGGIKQWTRQFGGANENQPSAIASDAADNIFVAGTTFDALDGQASAGGFDLFVTKYDASGNKKWTRQLGTASQDQGKGVTSDSAGNVYVTGITFGALDGQTSAGGIDFYTTKYDSAGVKQWTRQLGTASEDQATAITSDAAGNVYVTGYTLGALDGQSSLGGIDLFITKYDTNGVKQWTRQFGSAGNDLAHGISNDAAGNVYVTGDTSGAIDGQASAGGIDLFVTKFDTGGVKQWARQFGTVGTDIAYAIASDAAGNVYAAGYTDGALDGLSNAGLWDIFIVKYQADGRKR